MTNADDSNIMEAVFSRRKYNDGVRNKLRTVNTRLRFLLSPNIFISILQSPEICWLDGRVWLVYGGKGIINSSAAHSLR